MERMSSNAPIAAEGGVIADVKVVSTPIRTARKTHRAAASDAGIRRTPLSSSNNHATTRSQDIPTTLHAASSKSLPAVELGALRPRASEPRPDSDASPRSQSNSKESLPPRAIQDLLESDAC